MRRFHKRLLGILVVLGLLGISACTSPSVEAARLLKKGATKQDWLTNVGSLENGTFKPREGKAVPGVEWQYTAKKGGFGVLYMSFKQAELAGMQNIHLWVRSNKQGPIAVTMTESDNSNYQVFMNLPAETWKEIVLPPSKLSFDTDTVDENKRLDPEQITRFAIVDTSGLTGKVQGSRTVLVTELEIELASAAEQPPLKGAQRDGDDSTAEIYTMRIDGTGLERLTFNKYYENHVHISPDKAKLVFTAFTEDLNRDREVGEADMDSSEVGVMDVDGGNYRLLTKNKYADFGAVWSPDGKRILFTTNRFGQFDLATIKADGSDFKRLTSTPDVFEMDPHWGGDTIVFNRWAPGKNPYPGIWKIRSDGSGEKQLTNPTFPNASKGAPFGDMDPKVSPDGKKIVFERHQSNKGNFGFGEYNLYVMDINGGNLNNISRNSNAEAVPVWSPDGKRIAFWSVSDKSRDALSIIIANADGSGRERIAKGFGRLHVEMPSWIDNQTLVFSGKVPRK